MKKLKWSRKKIVGLIAAVLVAVVIVVSAVNAGGTEGRYQETTVAARDIVSYLEFSGNIEAVDVSNVYAGVAAQIREVKVEEGDQVEAGDVIAVLDSSEVEYNIAVQEATLNEAELTDSYNIKDSQTSLDNLNEQLDSGLNSTLNTAQETLLTAQQNYQDAVETYNQAKEELDNGTTQAVVSARQSVASAQASYDSAEDQHENHMITDEALATYAVTLSNAQESLRLAQETAEQDVQDYYDAMVEVPAYIGKKGPEVIAQNEIPLFQQGLMMQQLNSEKLLVEGCIEGSYEKVLEAFTLNKTVPSMKVAKEILDDMIEANKEYWPELK